VRKCRTRLPVLLGLLAGEEEGRLDDARDAAQHEENGDELSEAAGLLQEQPRGQTEGRRLLEIQ
jgi:hypothetical protein